MKQSLSLLQSILMFTFMLFCNPAFAVEENDSLTQEVQTLLQFIRQSPCRFNRNGNWYDPAAAADHIQKKYRYGLKKGIIHSTEDFILHAATKSSLSGKMYMVKCNQEQPKNSSEWLISELDRIRIPQEKKVANPD